MDEETQARKHLFLKLENNRVKKKTNYEFLNKFL